MGDKTIKIKLTDIKLMVYDFDGVMTDNRVIVDQNGNEAVIVNRADGLAVAAIKKHGVPQIILSTESNPVVRQRAKKLGLPVINDCHDKKASLLEYCSKNDIDPKKVLYVGNDVNDLEVMKNVGYKICPSDAHHKIKKISDIIMKTKGGGGVLREMADVLGLI
ncbi:MAG: HAD hydrolase family protein [Candidatus Margulisiibacteriota bacterium]